jgi:hypothetical protein
MQVPELRAHQVLEVHPVQVPVRKEMRLSLSRYCLRLHCWLRSHAARQIHKLGPLRAHSRMCGGNKTQCRHNNARQQAQQQGRHDFRCHGR